MRSLLAYEIIVNRDEKFTRWLLELLISIIKIAQYSEGDLKKYDDKEGNIDAKDKNKNKCKIGTYTQKKLSKTHENDCSFIQRGLNEYSISSNHQSPNEQLNDDNAEENNEDYLMSFCPKPQSKFNKDNYNYLGNNNDNSIGNDSIDIDNANNSKSNSIIKESTSNLPHFLKNNKGFNNSNNKQKHNQKKKRSQSAIHSYHYKTKSFFAFDSLPLSIEDLKKEIIYQTKCILSPSKFNTLTHSKQSFNKSIEKIITSLFTMPKTSNNNLNGNVNRSTKSIITYNYIKQNLYSIHQLIYKTFNQCKLINHNDIIKQIAIAMMNDHCILKNINDIESAVTKVRIKSKKLLYELNKKMSSSHITRVKQIYRTAYQYEEEKYIEERNNFNSICVRKEAKIILENKDIDDYYIKTKEYLKELHRYEKFKRDKENHLKKLTIITSSSLSN